MSSKARILVIDDRERMVKIVQRILEKEGYEVLTAFDGLEGLRKAQEKKPNLIILDIIMPRMDGYEVCRRLRSDPDTAGIPILLLTVKGQLDEPDIDDETLDARLQERNVGFEAGAIEFLSKPVTMEELLDRVRPLLWFDSLPIE